MKNPKNQKFEKMKKHLLEILSFYTRDIIILHICTKNHNHMSYSSWDTKCDKKILPFLAIFCPLTHPTPNHPLTHPPTITTQKTKILGEKYIWRCHHFKLVQQKTRSYDVCLLRYGVRQTIFCHFSHFLFFYPTIDPEN